MDISGISTSVSARSLFASAAASTELEPLQHDKDTRELRHDHHHGGKGRRGLALGVFRQELRIALKAHFHSRITPQEPNYLKLAEPANSDVVAAEAIGTARQLAAESPTKAAKALISFRARVHETASYVRQTVGAESGIDDVDTAVAKVDAGLTKIEDEVAPNRESSASVLAVDTKTKQRSSIRIRTQEGDVVKLSLRRVDRMSATDIAKTNGDTSMTSTEVEVSSRSRLMLKVDGDLNETELAAIQNVFEQAERIADEFFGGDIGAAFDLAQGFEFDTEQLARVNMRFRMRQDSSVSYTESVRAATITPVTIPAVAAPESVASAPDATAQASSPVPDAVIAAVSEPIIADESVEVEVGKPLAPETSAFSSFFDALSIFLRTVSEGFSMESGSGSFRYHYSESFKLELLRTVIHTVAPDESQNAATNAELLIEGISEPTETV